MEVLGHPEENEREGIPNGGPRSREAIFDHKKCQTLLLNGLGFFWWKKIALMTMSITTTTTITTITTTF